MLLADVAAATAAVAATSARSQKVALLADCLRAADAGEVAVVVAYLSGELQQRRTGVGWASLRDLPAPAAGPASQQLTVLEVDAAFEA
ncbi:MAG: ATP-dependent DNA ligase, partial [Actinomycetes bacterium]